MNLKIRRKNNTYISTIFNQSIYKKPFVNINWCFYIANNLPDINDQFFCVGKISKKSPKNTIFINCLLTSTGNTISNLPVLIKENGNIYIAKNNISSGDIINIVVTYSRLNKSKILSPPENETENVGRIQLRIQEETEKKENSINEIIDKLYQSERFRELIK